MSVLHVNYRKSFAAAQFSQTIIAHSCIAPCEAIWKKDTIETLTKTLGKDVLNT